MVSKYMKIKNLISISSFCLIIISPVSFSAEQMTLDQARQEIDRLQQENSSLKEQLQDFEKQIKKFKEKIAEHDMKEEVDKSELDN